MHCINAYDTCANSCAFTVARDEAYNVEFGVFSAWNSAIPALQALVADGILKQV